MVAIYARKSVFKEDSISVESQVEKCEYYAEGDDYLVYKDNGFSGKNTERPEFQKMMNDIESGIINKVIVYKVDRISRSLSDFSKMMELFEKNKVDFVSATETFDTATPIGTAMLNIIITFAQLERQQTQQRVIDAFISRSRKGYYMGGKVAYGFDTAPIEMDGIKTSMYVPREEETKIIQLMYELYSSPTYTLGSLHREFAKRGYRTRLGNGFSKDRLSAIMRNPIYVKANIDVYNFFKAMGTKIINPPEDFESGNGLYLYTGDNPNRRTWDLSGHILVVAPHEGIIDPDIWLACRRKIMANHSMKITNAKNTILAGKLKCGHCGHAITARGTNKEGKKAYFYCSGRTNLATCDAPLPTLNVVRVEQTIADRIKEKLNSLSIKKSTEKSPYQEEIEKLETEIETINTKIDNLIDTLANASSVAMGYINTKIEELDKAKSKLLNEITQLQAKEKQNNTENVTELIDVMSKWDDLTFDDKRAVIELLIEKILVYSDRIEITWKI